MSYQAPPWARTPSASTPWTLVEIKGGVQVARHALQTKCVWVGRDADQAQIAVAHASCSRIHARIAFDAAGTPWLRDLASTHGTRVNKKPLPTAACGRPESNATHAGARGVVLYPNDLLQFGASSRLFTLEGPEAFGRTTTAAVLRRRVPHSVSSSASANPATGNHAVDEDSRVRSWGMDLEDDPGGAPEQNNASTPMKLPVALTEADIPPGLRKDWEAYLALQYKLTHTTEESERIRRKGNLTEGQDKQLAKNQERMDNIRQEMEAKEVSLYRRLYPEKVKLAKQRQAEKSAYYQEDEVEDRTRDRNRSRNLLETGEAETEQSLTRQRSLLLDTRGDVEAGVRSYSRQHSDLKRQIASMQANGEEEVFFIQNEVDMAADALKKEKEKLGDIDEQLEQVYKLLKVVNPKLVFDVPSTEIAHHGALDESGFTMPMPVSRTAVHTATDDDAFPQPEMLPPRACLPPPKRRRVRGAAMPPPSFVAATPVTKSTTEAVTSTFLPLPPPRQVLPHHNITVDHTLPLVAATAAATSSDEKHDKWRAPKDQDGSGMTKLNAKFAGRY
jgi:pSer/pThr/pTyr-binding forkhead associated (FHA) protein